MKSFHSFVRTLSLGLAALAVASTASAATETIFTETFSGSYLAGTTSLGSTQRLTPADSPKSGVEGLFRSGTADNDGWYGCDVIRSPTSIRLGNSENKGWAQSPAITLTNGVATADITVTLYACKSHKNANGAIVSILDAEGNSLNSQTLSDLTVVSTAAEITAEGNLRTLTFTDVPTGFMLRFDAAQSDGRVIVDEITVLQDIPEASGDAPAFTAPETVTLIADKAGSFSVSALASDGVTPLEVTLASVSPTPASAQPVWDGSTLTWTPTEADVGTYDFVFQATVSGTAYEQTVSVTVASGAPVFTAPAEVTLETGAEGAFAVQAAQADGTVCAVTLASVSPTPASAQPIWDGSMLTWTPTEADVGVYALVFETLVNGTSYQQTVSVTVEIPVPMETVFVETFSGSDLSTTAMGSPELVSPSRTESGEFLSNTADHAGWIGQAVYRSHYSIRLGNGSYKGWAQSPAITLTNGVATADITVTLYACKSGEDANGAIVSILDASGATLESQTLANLTHVTAAAGITAEGNFKTLSFTNVPTGFMLRLDPAQPDGAVIFDTITVQQTLVEVSENAPTFTAPASVEIPAGTAGSFTVTAMKTDGTAAVVTLAGISPVPAASQGTFDGTSFTWTPTVQDVGAYTVTFQSAVGAETFTHAVPVTVTVDNLAEVVPTISDVGYNHFQLDWTDAQLRTSGYGLRIWYGADDYTSTGVDTCTFAGTIPLLWEAEGSVSFYSDGSLQLGDSGEGIITALYPSPVTGLTYNINKQGVNDSTTASAQFSVYATADTSDTPAWTLISDFVGAANIVNGDTVLTFDESLGYRRFRFVYTTKATGNIRLRSVDAVYAGAGATIAVGSASAPLALDKSVDSYEMTNARADTLYYVQFFTYDGVDGTVLDTVYTLKTPEAPTMTVIVFK